MSVQKINILLRYSLSILCVCGVFHEMTVIGAYNPLELNKSPGSIAIFFMLIGVMFLWDKTSFFCGALLVVRSYVFWMVILLFLFVEVAIYWCLFGEVGGRIHKFAPFNFYLIFMLLVVLMICLFGEQHLGVLNKIKS